MYRTHSEDDFYEVRRLSRSGCSDYEVARRLGIARATVQNWRKRTTPPRSSRAEAAATRFEPACPAQYVYLLGAYLGDGHLWKTSKNSWRLSIYCDSGYPEIISELDRAIAVCSPRSSICHNQRKGSAGLIIAASSRLWPLAFPQHGPGRKHDRPIRLEPWQTELTHAHPRSLLRGLVHSDGCRVTNRFKTKLPSGRLAEYSYPRYFFSNLSTDILEIFCAHCELVGVRWTQSNHRNISIADRESVALLDSFIGPKS